MNVVLISTYDLGHQPFALASPQAWLKRAGHTVYCVDLAVEDLPKDALREADVVAFHLPMHTGTRLALPVIRRLKLLHPSVRIACYGLYAPLQEELLRSMGVEGIFGGEFEAGLVAFATGEEAQRISLERLVFPMPDRSGLPDLSRYSKLHINGDSRAVAYTEASRGCKHLCRHCPVVPVYDGQFRVVQRETVLNDIRQQVEAGAQHVTFGDPDFFNGPTHAAQIVRALHSEFPDLTYDATIKVEHVLKHRDLLGTLKGTGCVLITSAVEALDDTVLEKLQKGHTRQDFFDAVALTREAGITLQPTFIAFTPWTVVESYRELLQVLLDLDLVENVAPVQLALRLLITPGSRLLELEEIRRIIGPLDPASLVYPWVHADPRVDELGHRVFAIAESHSAQGRRAQFAQIWIAAGMRADSLPNDFLSRPSSAIPYFDEPWYCCAEPVAKPEGLVQIG
jgi:radical SAM superfamily enzyme YgiQ (UPF0313 family)